jgi:hypothetical protein
VHRSSGFLALDEAGPGQHVEMLHHRRQRHRKRRGNLRHRQLVLAREAIEDGSPRRVGERGEGKIEPDLVIVNHLVKYWRVPADMSRVEPITEV